MPPMIASQRLNWMFTSLLLERMFETQIEENAATAIAWSKSDWERYSGHYLKTTREIVSPSNTRVDDSAVLLFSLMLSDNELKTIPDCFDENIEAVSCQPDSALAQIESF